MNYRHVALVPVRGIIKVYLSKHNFQGYLEPRDLLKVLSVEEFAVHDAGQMTLIMDFDKVEPFLKQPWKNTK